MDSLAEDDVTLPLDFDRRYLKKKMSLSLGLFDKLLSSLDVYEPRIGHWKLQIDPLFILRPFDDTQIWAILMIYLFL